MLVARALTALVAGALAGPRARRRLAARAVEAGHVGALAQRWSRTSAILGGPVLPNEGFGAVTFDTLGLARDPRHPGVRHTALGTYRLLCAGPELSAHAARLGVEAPAGGGLLVVGTGETPEAAVAVLVLGPLVQVGLPDVPWEWIRRLTTPERTPLAAPAPAAARRPEGRNSASRTPRRIADLPQRARRMPSWRSPKPTTRRRDREMAG